MPDKMRRKNKIFVYHVIWLMFRSHLYLELFLIGKRIFDVNQNYFIHSDTPNGPHIDRTTPLASYMYL